MEFHLYIGRIKMDTLERIFEDELTERLSFRYVGTKIIKKKLEQKGISLNEKQLKKVRKQLKKIEENRQRNKHELTGEQFIVLDIPESDSIAIDISDYNNELEEFSKEFDEKLFDLIPEVVDMMSQILLTRLENKAPRMLRQRRERIKTFQHKLSTDWENAFDLFEMFLNIAYEVGDDFNKEFRKAITEEDQFLLEALTRLHARACQVSGEIFVLMQNGYADGAHARWRTLHEIAVVGSFISSNGNELAEKYLLHDNIESYKAASQYQKYYEELGCEPIPDEEYESITKVYEELLTRFGNQFKNEYGWAASVLNKNNPSFFDIEQKSDLNHLRPLYKLASHNVHANPKGVMFKMGLIDNSRNILLAGPSNTGFTDAAQETVISLGNITITLITQRPNIDYLVISTCLLKLIPDISDEFYKVQEKIENRASN